MNILNQLKNIIWFDERETKSEKKERALKEKINLENKLFEQRMKVIVENKKKNNNICLQNEIESQYKLCLGHPIQNKNKKIVKIKEMNIYPYEKSEEEEDFIDEITSIQNYNSISTNKKQSDYDSYISSFYNDRDSMNNNTIINFDISQDILLDNFTPQNVKMTFKEIYEFSRNKDNLNDYPLINLYDFERVMELINRGFSEEHSKISLRKEKHFEQLISDLLINKTLHKSVLFKYIILLEERANDNKDMNYPNCIFIPLYGKYLINPDKVLNTTLSKYERIIIPIKLQEWNVIMIIPNEYNCYYYPCGVSKMKFEELENISRRIINDEIDWKYNHCDYFPAKTIGTNQCCILPLILIDYLSRNAKISALTSEDISYFIILKGMELLNKEIYTH